MPRTPEQRGPGAPVGDGDGAMPLGSVALVRVAGMPWESWAAAGNEPLAARAVALDRETARLAGRARALGERLGAEIVPDDRLSVPDRRAVLALRRALHAGRADVARADAGCTDASGGARSVHAGVAAVAGLNPGLADALTALEHDAAVLGAARERMAADVAAERARVGGALLSLARTHPVLHDFVTTSSPRLLDDLARHVRAGEPWTGKRPRKGTGYVWRALARTAAKTTPRGWAGQVAAVPVVGDRGEGVGDPGAGSLLPYGARLDAVAAVSTENVHRLWVSLRALDLRTAPPSTLLALTPLHCFTEGEFHCRAVDTGEAEGRAGGGGVRGGSARLRRLALRRTPVLDAVLAVLADGPRALGGLENELAGGHGEKGRTVLRGFLAHLLGLGVLQICSVPESRRLEWTAGPAAVAKAPLRHPVPHGWFLDSYRTTDATVSAGAAARVTDGLRLARRLDALRALDVPAVPDTSTEATPHTGPGWQVLDEAARIGTEPRPLLDILDDHDHDHDAGSATNEGPADPGERVEAVPRARYEGWRPARTPGSAYALLLGHLAERLDEDSVDLDEATLDALGAPPVPDWAENWPTDCLLRPLATADPSGDAGGDADGEPAAEPLAVLESASPAGVLDARFAEALDGLHEDGYANVRAYRAFLAAYERATGTRFVELLVPPLGEPAANAVRRPAVTTWCTGDPDTGLYHPPDDLGSVRHLPLHRVTLRRAGPDGGTLVAEADGVRLLPLHHGTRTPVPPYDRVLRLLTAAGHPALQYAVQLGGLAGAFPGAERVPRLTVGGSLVVSAAQWRVPRARLWRPSDPEPEKAARLAALRRAAGLPRFGYVRTEPGGKPLPVDLAALPVFQAVERLCQSAPDGHDLWFEEALPAPVEGAHALHDPAHGEPSAAGAGTPRDALVPDGPRVATQLLLRLPHDRTADSLAALAAGATDLPGTRPSSDGGAPGRTHPQREVREGKHHACHRIS